MNVKQVLTIEMTPEDLSELIKEGVKSVISTKKEDDVFINRKKAAKILDCSYSYLDNCELKKYRNESGTLTRYKKSEVMEFLKNFEI